MNLLTEGPKQNTINDEVHKKYLEIGHLIEARCREFSVEGEVTAYHPGPVVTTFEFKPSAGVKYAKVVNLGDDLALALKAESIRIERISGSSTVGIEVPNLTGGVSEMLPNHHITKPVLIGEIQADGQFEIVQETPAVVGDEWSDYLPDSKDLISDWRKPMACGNFNVKTGKCGGKVTN